jgi:hypothetical protein
MQTPIRNPQQTVDHRELPFARRQSNSPDTYSPVVGKMFRECRTLSVTYM